MPEVSVIMSAYNAERTVERAVRCILNQTFTDFELIVVDDGSTDRTAHLLYGFGDGRVRILRNRRNIGLTASLNRALAASRGKLIARQDADDYSMPRRLEKQVAFLSEHAEVALLGSQGRQITPEGKSATMTRATTDESIRWESLFYNSFIHTSVMFRRPVAWETLGGYDESVSYCQDYELWSRIMTGHKVANLDEILVERHEAPDGMTGTISTRRSSEAQAAAFRHFGTVFGEQLQSETYEPLYAHYFGGERISSRDLLRGTRRMLRAFKERYPGATTRPDFWQTVSRRFRHTAAVSWKGQKFLSGLAVGTSALLDPRGLFRSRYGI